MRKLSRLAGAVALAVASAAYAATDTTAFKVQILITESCTISTVAATDVNFGTNPRQSGASNIIATGQLSVNCSEGTPYAIGLTGGLYSTGATPAPVAGDRRMKHSVLAAVFVPYELYQDAGRSTFWGNTTGSRLTGTGTGNNQAVPVYGSVTNVNFPAGVYEDTVTATVTY